MDVLDPAAQSRRVLILHYSAPPVIGGVESTVYHHACLLAGSGYSVQVMAGRGGDFDPQVAFLRLPEMDSCHAEVLAVKRELDQGRASAQFQRLRERLVEHLRPSIAAADVLIAHNILTLHKNLPLTAALYRVLVEERPPHVRILAWHHDLAWRNPQYAKELHPGYPWDLLRQCWPGVVQVAVSEPRRSEVAALYGIPSESVAVVRPGVDLASFLRWTEMTQRIVEAYRLLEANLILLLPARITRRKNIQLGVRTLAALREKTGLDIRLLVTGPPGPHNPSNVSYLDQLRALRGALGLEEAVHFVYELGDEAHPLVPDEATVASLYLLADALLFPSLDEGFGVPLLEAGLMRLPIFCSRIASLQATGGMEVQYFAPEDDPAVVADLIARHLLTNPTFSLRRRVLQEHRWEYILQHDIIPLVEGRQPQNHDGRCA